MQISAASLIGPRSVAGAAGFQAIDPTSGATLEPVFGRASAQDVEAACVLAEQAFDAFATCRSPRARSSSTSSPRG